MAALPQGALPGDYKTAVAELVHEVGVSVMTFPVLIRRLEARYGIDFSSHKDTVYAFVESYMRTPQLMRELAEAQKAKEEGPAGGKGKKRARASSAKEAKGKKEKKESSRKAEKPADYPKGPMSAYILFGNATRGKIKDENPDMKVTEVLKKLGEMWNAASAETKAHYNKLAEADKERHEREMKAYLAKGGSIVKRGSKSKKTKKEKDPNAPKRATSAFFFFAADFRTSHSSLPVKEQMTKAGEEWRAMSEDAKKPYDEKAAKDKERYQRECAAKGIKTSSGATKAGTHDAASSSSSVSSSASSSDSSSEDEE